MSYTYDKYRADVLTDEGQRMFLKMRDHTRHLLTEAGAVRADRMMQGAGGGDSWLMLACIDRMVELGEIRDVTGQASHIQDRVYVAAKGPIRL